MPETEHSPTVRVREVRVLSDDWYVLRKTTFDYRRRGRHAGRRSRARPTTAATARDPALRSRGRGTVLLTRQFR